MEGAGRRLERHADVGNAKLRGRGRHAHSVSRHGFPPSPGDYIAKAMPAAIAVCVCLRALIEAQRPTADDGKLRPVHKLSAALSRTPRGIRDITWPPHSPP